MAAAALLAGCAHKPAPAPADPSAPILAVPSSTPAPLRQSWLQKLPKLPKLPNILPKGKPKPPVALPPQWAGTIRMVNTEGRFVLIESGALGTIRAGENYISVSESRRETATLHMTTLRNPPFLIADIVSGTPSTGERIYNPGIQKAPPPVDPTPPPVAAAPTPQPESPADSDSPTVRVVLPSATRTVPAQATPRPTPAAKPTPAPKPTPSQKKRAPAGGLR